MTTILRSFADLPRLLEERGAMTLSIQRPQELTHGKWVVAYRTTPAQLKWHQGKGDNFISALEACLGVEVRSATDLKGIL